MAFCPECGTQNDDNAAFCGNCGSNLQSTPEQPTGYQQPQSGYQQPQSGYQQPQQGYQQPMGPPGSQFMMMRKGKGGPMIFSCFCAGLGMLLVDSNKYTGKAIGIFVVAFVGLFFLLIPTLIAWIIGLIWTSQAVDEYNRDLSAQYGVAPY